MASKTEAKAEKSKYRARGQLTIKLVFPDEAKPELPASTVEVAVDEKVGDWLHEAFEHWYSIHPGAANDKIALMTMISDLVDQGIGGIVDITATPISQLFPEEDDDGDQEVPELPAAPVPGQEVRGEDEGEEPGDEAHAAEA